MTVLILGGTAEARLLAQVLVDAGRPVVSSLAGRVSSPALPVGEVRIGGFGAVAGLVGYLRRERVWAVVDATHPFAAQISRHAVAAAQEVGLPLIRLARPGWSDHPQAGSWTWVSGAAEAVAASSAERPFLTTGRQSLADFLPWRERRVLVRVVDPPEFELPDRWQLIRSRGPYRYDDERRLMLGHGTDLLVTKDSGGSYTRAKLDAAADLGVPVVIITRPSVPSGVALATDVTQVVDWLSTLPAP